jgi:drug/metabolite transporter (DMT)-like permease
MSSVAAGLSLIVICAFIEGLAQISWKLSSQRPDRKTMWVALGGLAYAIEIPLYTVALKMIDVTVAFAMGSLSFVAVAVLSRVLLGERISAKRGAGLFLILSGVALMGGQA